MLFNYKNLTQLLRVFLFLIFLLTIYGYNVSANNLKSFDPELNDQGFREDVLILVNENSIDSPAIGEYYAQKRDVDPGNIAYLRVPTGYFMTWTDFRNMRDQIIRFMQERIIEKDSSFIPVVCTTGDTSYYCEESISQLRENTSIRYILTTRGIPSRMVIDDSPYGSQPASVDGYLRSWLANYYTEDTSFSLIRFEEFYMQNEFRPVNPSFDKEFIIARIDGIDYASTVKLIDRTLKAESEGVYGQLYSHQYLPTIEVAGYLVHTNDWRYQLAKWNETQNECSNEMDENFYLNFDQADAAGKTPENCQVNLMKTSGINEKPPATSSSRQPIADNALIYFGWKDGQATTGSFDEFLNWRYDHVCSNTLCDSAADPEICRAESTDVFKEIDTRCVGVADGFIGYNFQSFPVSYYHVWPTGWFSSTNTTKWSGKGGGDVKNLAFPHVLIDEGFNDSMSVFFGTPDEASDALCYGDEHIDSEPSIDCQNPMYINLTQDILFPAEQFNTDSPQSFKIKFHYKTEGIVNPENTKFKVSFFVHEEEGGSKDQIIYQPITSSNPITAGTHDWILSEEVIFQLDPALHSPDWNGKFDGVKVRIETTNSSMSGSLWMDDIILEDMNKNINIVQNGSFDQGHKQVATGDHAANFLNRLNGVAFWGSMSHHMTGGISFGKAHLVILDSFLKGLPLASAVWMAENYGDGMFYGDPLYSPVKVRIDSLDAESSPSHVKVYGSAMNGNDPSIVDTAYSLDLCEGSDIYFCDQTDGWQSTGIDGLEMKKDELLGEFEKNLLMDSQDYILRLSVTTTHLMTNRTQTFNDFHVFTYPLVIPAEIISPISHSLATTPLNITWNAIEEATGYTVRIGSEYNGYDIFSQDFGQELSAVLNIPLFEHTIYLQVLTHVDGMSYPSKSVTLYPGNTHEAPIFVNFWLSAEIPFDQAYGKYIMAEDPEGAEIQYSATFGGNPVSTIGADFQIVLLGDVSGDGIVNFVDLGLMKKAFFSTRGDSNYNPRADFDNNDTININDLGILKENFLQTEDTGTMVGLFLWVPDSASTQRGTYTVEFEASDGEVAKRVSLYLTVDSPDGGV